MKRGEIWLVSLDPTSGHEQKGRRPVLIVSPEPFNRVTKVPVVLPITSGGNFARTAGFAVPLTGAGTKTTGIIRCDQPRALDLTHAAAKSWKPFRMRSWAKCWREYLLYSTARHPGDGNGGSV
jgi:mRNA-degrading endonuclease toxin of MazEF toxin-antitoxin module